jgi:hypothetical protein
MFPECLFPAIAETTTLQSVASADEPDDYDETFVTLLRRPSDSECDTFVTLMQSQKRQDFNLWKFLTNPMMLMFLFTLICIIFLSNIGAFFICYTRTMINDNNNNNKLAYAGQMN